MGKARWFLVAALIFFFGAILPSFIPSLDLFTWVGLSAEHIGFLLFFAMILVVWQGGVWEYLKGLTRGKIMP